MRQGITEEQSRLLRSWLGEFSVVRDHSWPLQDTNVLHVATRPGEEFIVKASTASHHIHCEIAAHARGFEGLHGRVPVLRHASGEAGILVTEFLPGILVEGTPAEDEPETYRQAGELLARIHRPAGESSTYAKALTAKTRAWMERAQGLLPESQLDSFEQELDALRPGLVQLVATHGDYQPRNWLQDNGPTRWATRRLNRLAAPWWNACCPALEIEPPNVGTGGTCLLLSSGGSTRRQPEGARNVRQSVWTQYARIRP